jgi:glycosyltransferase involved in cell wall biosynthesis
VQSIEPGVPFRLDIRGAGNGGDGERIRHTCLAAAQQDSRIVFGEAVSREDVSALLASWDVLCCPGRSLEGGPTVALEAFAVGTPVFGTRIGGLAELLTDRDNGRLVEPGDWRALASVIRELATYPHLLDEWRTKLPAPRSMRDVTADYLTAYHA